MFTVNINGKNFQTENDRKLIDVLRDDLHLMSVKNGCGEASAVPVPS